MENNQNLLANILKKRYADVPEKIQQINSLVEEYTKGNGTKMDYEKILNALHGMIANDVPQNILLYFLTTIPLPNENIGKCESDSDLYNLMQKSRITLPESINHSLQKYFKELTRNGNGKDTIKETENPIAKKDNNKRDINDNNNEDDVFIKPKRKSKVSRKISNFYDCNMEDCKSLLDISAQYVITNFSALHQFYTRRNEMVWNILHTNPCHEVAKICFEVLKDLNKKRKWLRMIDSNNISVESLRDEFNGGFLLLKKLQKPPFESRMNAFEVTEELKDAVNKYIDS